MTTQTTKQITVDLADQIGLVTEQVKGVLLLISINMDADNKANDQIVKASVDSAIASIDRIDELVLGNGCMGTERAAKPSPKTAAFDAAFNAFCDIQRAQAVLALILDGYAEEITDENVLNSLFVVQNEVNSGLDTLERFIYPKDDTTTDKPQEFVEVERWADNYLYAAGNRYRLFDVATKSMLAEFDAESLADAKVKAGIFLRDRAKGDMQ